MFLSNKAQKKPQKLNVSEAFFVLLCGCFLMQPLFHSRLVMCCSVWIAKLLSKC